MPTRDRSGPERFVEPSIFEKRLSLIRARLRRDPGPGAEELKEKLREIRSRAVEGMDRNIAAFKKSLKARGIEALDAKDAAAAAGHVSKYIENNNLPEAVLVNRSSAVRELEHDLALGGISIIKTYDNDVGRVQPLWANVDTASGAPRFTFELTPPPVEDIFATFRYNRLPTRFYDGPVLPEESSVGLLGVNAAGADDGSVYFLQHTTNISRIFNSVEAAILVVPVDKILPTWEEAQFQTRCAAGFGAGSILADLLLQREEGHGLEKKDVPEARFSRHESPGKISVILLDNGRTSTSGRDRDMLMCIGCKACTAECVRARLPDQEVYRNPRDLALSGARGDPAHSVEMGLFNCTLCGMCEMSCPVGIQLPSILKDLRTTAIKSGVIPEAHKVLSSNVVHKGNPFGGEQSQRTEFYTDFLESRERKPDRVLLFLGCLPSYQHMKITQSTLRIFRKMGVEPTLLGDKETCCGFPLYIIGHPDFEKVAKKASEAIKAEEPEMIITPCSGCHRGLREVFPEAGIDLDAPVLHLTEYIAQQISKGALELKDKGIGPVTYHDPCDIGRHFKIFDPPRKILEAIPGVEFRELKRNRDMSKCCGGGGGMMGYNTKLSENMAYERLCEAELVLGDVKKGTLASACPACVTNLSQAAPRFNREGKMKLRVRDLTELLIKSL